MLEQHWIKEVVFSSLEILSTWGEVGFDVYIYWSDISEGWLRKSMIGVRSNHLLDWGLSTAEK